MGDCYDLHLVLRQRMHMDLHKGYQGHQMDPEHPGSRLGSKEVIWEVPGAIQWPYAVQSRALVATSFPVKSFSCHKLSSQD